MKGFFKFQNDIIEHAKYKKGFTSEDKLKFLKIVYNNVIDFLSSKAQQLLQDGDISIDDLNNELSILFSGIESIDLHVSQSRAIYPASTECIENMVNLKHGTLYELHNSYAVEFSSVHSNIIEESRSKVYYMNSANHCSIGSVIRDGINPAYILPIIDMSYKEIPNSDTAIKESHLSAVDRVAEYVILRESTFPSIILTNKSELCNTLKHSALFNNDIFNTTHIIYCPSFFMMLPFLNGNDRRMDAPKNMGTSVTEKIICALQHVRYKSYCLTLYRAGGANSSLVHNLCYAAQQGKQVYVHIEISARGDENKNIAIFNKLKDAGCILTTNYLGKKVHGKVFIASEYPNISELLGGCTDDLEMRKRIDAITDNNDGICIFDRNYNIFSTGNFNYKTERQYSDVYTIEEGNNITALNYFACLFNSIDDTQYMSTTVNEERDCFGSAIRKRIIRELYLSAAGTQNYNSSGGLDGSALIICNQLTDKQILAVMDRIGFEKNCSSIIRNGYNPHCHYRRIGNSLQHARLYVFKHFDVDAEKFVISAYISSSDLMNRNLSNRMEYMHALDSDNDVRVLLNSYISSLDMDEASIFKISHYENDSDTIIDPSMCTAITIMKNI